MTLYAIWELNVATITLNSNDGTSNTKQVTVTKGKETKLPVNSFIRKGYTFLAWNTKADGTGTKYEEEAMINVEADITLYAIWKAPSTVQEARIAGIVLNQNNPTTLTDTYGNEVKLPEGFKIASDSADDVTGGVVIEDVSNSATAGSQFVWIPVGTVYTNTEKTTSKTITLNRYTFNSSGNPTPQGENVIETYYQELATSNKGNTVAKDINGFKTSATTNKGYYMGRYEARSVTQRKSSTDALAQVTEKANDYVYNYVTQPQAATLARGMYGTNKKFTSDLVNSYAWDTAIAFLQTFDNRTDKTKPYSRQNSLNTTLAPKGTNNLTETTKQDKICNIWDMTSNDIEWITETCSAEAPAVNRGGNYQFADNYTCYRYRVIPSSAHDYRGFRSILYL